MDGVQQSQGYRAITRRQFTFYHLGPKNSWYSFYQPRMDERLSQPWSHPGFELGTPGFGFPCLNRQTIAPF